MELLNVLCQVIDAVHERQSPEYLSETHRKQLRSLTIRIQGLVQHHSGVISSPDPDSEGGQHTKQIAELYRLATLIYLLVIAKGDSIEGSEVNGAMERAFGLLCNMEQCERPWPLFILGLAAHSEEQRFIVLKVIEKSLALQPLGPMALADRMIRDAWIQQDLTDNEEPDLLELYSQVISRNRVPPCFA